MVEHKINESKISPNVLNFVLRDTLHTTNINKLVIAHNAYYLRF